jgi:hypothetical protein
MTPAERALLLAVFRWAYAERVDLHVLLYKWSRPGPSTTFWGIDYTAERTGCTLAIRRGRLGMADYFVASVAEAVDVLVALGILPAQFSTAYRAGWDAALGSGAKRWPRRMPRAPRELVRP